MLAGQALAQPEEKRSALIDPQDGKLDASEWLLEKKGFLPIPTIITEPAVGYGVGVGLMFFRESIGEAVERSRASGHVTPPDVYGVMLAATENGTKLGGAGGIIAKGVGVRYLIARRLGLFMGIDIARGPENTAFYIQTGSAWR